jgi:hypothetical protein
MHDSKLSLNTTFFHRSNQLQVSADDGSHHEAGHKNIKGKCLLLHLLLEISLMIDSIISQNK